MTLQYKAPQWSQCQRIDAASITVTIQKPFGLRNPKGFHIRDKLERGHSPAFPHNCGL